MTTKPTAFPYTTALALLRAGEPVELLAGAHADSPLRLTSLLEALLTAEQLHASRRQIGQVTDILRRDQKFVRPGPPSPHLVRLRQQQAAARQAGNQAQLAYVKAAQQLVRSWALEVPARLAVETFADQWIAQHIPMDATSG
ncbi:hypothetical protein ACYJW8_15585 [Frateuria aurantia]